MSVRRGLRAVLAVAAGMVTILVGARPSFAADVPWEYVLNHKAGPNYVLDMALTVKGHSAALKTPIVVSQTRWGAPYDGYQKWYTQVQSDGTYVFRNAGTSSWLALSVLNNSSADKTPVVQYTYQAGNAYQKWTLENQGFGWNKWRNVGTGKCLAVLSGASDVSQEGAAVIIYNCANGGPDHEWSDQYI